MTIVMRGSPAGGDSTQKPPENPQAQPLPPPAGQVTAEPPAAQQAVPGDENGQGDMAVEGSDEAEPDFPVQELARLDEMINRPRWVVPVLPKGELEILLDAAIKLCKEGKKKRHTAVVPRKFKVDVFH